MPDCPIKVEELRKLFELLDKNAFPVRKAVKANHYLDGITELVDKDGVPVLIMATKTYEDYKKEPDHG